MALALLLTLLLASGQHLTIADGGTDPGDALWRGLELSRAAGAAAQGGRRAEAAEKWRAAQALFTTGLAVVESGPPPPLPWDPARSPGPQLLLESARSLYYQSRPREALLRLRRLEDVLPKDEPGGQQQLHSVVRQWTFRCHAAAADYRGAADRLVRLLAPVGGPVGPAGVAGGGVALELAAWRQLSLPPDTQLQAAEALSRDVVTHPRLAVRVWQHLHESGVLTWRSVRRRARGGDIALAGREHWVLFLTSLHRCIGLPGTTAAAQQHRAACEELLSTHSTALRSFGSWISASQFPLAFDPSLTAEPSASDRQAGWLNSSDHSLRPCAVLAANARIIQSEWKEYLRNNGSSPKLPLMSAQHADSHLSGDSGAWEMLYLRRGNGSGGFLPVPCSAAAGPFRQTCALLSQLEEVSYAVQRYCE